MQLYAYYECNNKSKDLKSFQLVLANKDNEKKTLLAEVGPSSAVFIEEVLEVEEEVVDENSDDTFPEDGARNLQDETTEEILTSEETESNQNSTEVDGESVTLGDIAD